jgi:hypothetical protein
MKNIIKKSIALLLVLVSLFIVSSCSLFTPKPNMDLEDAEDNLKDEDYFVVYNDEGSAGIKENLVAYDDDNYLVIIYCETAKMANLQYRYYELNHERQIESYELKIKEYNYILSKFDKDLTSDEIDQKEDELKEIEKKLEELKKNYVIGKSGKIVWYGTKDAIKDSK